MPTPYTCASFAVGQNKRKSLHAVAVTAAVLFMNVIALAQGSGIQPGIVQVGGPDTIGLTNLNINISVPVVSKQGIGVPFTMALTFNNNFWRKAGSTAEWWPLGFLGTTGGWAIHDPLVGGAWNEISAPCPNGATEYNFDGYFDPSGNYHPFPSATAVSPNSGCAPPSATKAFNDGSGLTATVYPPGANTSYVITAAGVKFIPRGVNSGTNPTSGPTVVDPNGNSISWNATNKSYTDTLGISELTVTGSGTPSSPYIYTYPVQSGNGTASVTVNYTAYTLATHFNCSGVKEYPPTSTNLVSSIVLPDGTQYAFTYEITPGDTHTPHYVTGRLASATWPTGGTISYTYNNAATGNGVKCGDGSVPGLTRQTPDGTWTYSRGTGIAVQTTVTSPVDSSGHKTVAVYSFTGNNTINTYSVESRRQIYQDSTSGALLLTTLTCYNGNTTNCATAAAPTLPLTETDVYVTPGGMTQSSRATTFLDSYGNATTTNAYDFGGTLVRQTVTPIGTWNGSGCSAIGNGINNLICYQNIYNGSSYVRSEVLAYDSHGNLTSHTISPVVNVSQPGNLTTSYTYNANGTVNVATDVNGAQTTYAYNGAGGCNNGLPTSVTQNGLTEIFSYDCNGAVLSTATDANGQVTTYTYDDPFWRTTSIKDAAGTVTNTSYSPNSMESILNFGTSSVDVLKDLDSLGRVYITQRRQGPGTPNGDTTVTTYDSVGRPSFSSLPFSCTWASTSCSSSIGTTASYDALGRQTTASDSGGGVRSATFNEQDTHVTIGPAPASESVKQMQEERDALGRTVSTCLVSAEPGNISCGQAYGGYSGFPTVSTYDAAGYLLSATRKSSVGNQSRTMTRDGLGRVLTVHYPEETGSAQLFYDSAPSTPGTACSGSSPGDLVKKYDQNGNTTCFTYDSGHRVVSVTYSGPNFDGANKYFVYDSATVNGSTMQNGKGRLVEAYTALTQGGSKITDIGYSYDVLGRVTDVYESTPHSGGYYHTVASYAANGVIQSFSGLGAEGTFSYGLDGEGRPYSATQGTNHLVTGVTFNPASQPLIVSLGLGDSDTYTYDSNTGRVSGYTFTVGSTPKSVSGVLTWNGNGTLRTLALTDAFSSSGTQTCNYGDSSSAGYDDIGRLVKVDCGATIWQQNFSYDAFDNITKSVPGGGTGLSWMPGYNETNNHYTLAGTSYDYNGNLLNDTFHVYTWNQDNHPVTIDSTSCGTSGTCITYDALGRIVEKNVAGTYYQIEYSPLGKVGLMSAQAMQQGYVPLPGGDTFSPAPDTFWHRDWLGSVRFASSANNRTATLDRAFAPFGELYDEVTGGTLSPDFTGDTQDTISGEYDTPNRKLHPTQGRWISPDPAHASWNLYAYAGNNPLTITDSTGLAGDQLPTLLVGASWIPRPHVRNEFGGDWDGGVAPGGYTCEQDGIQTECGIVMGEANSGAGVFCDPSVCNSATVTVTMGGDAYGKQYSNPDIFECQVGGGCYPTHWVSVYLGNWGDALPPNINCVYVGGLCDVPLNSGAQRIANQLAGVAVTMNDWKTIAGWYLLSAAAGVATPELAEDPLSIIRLDVPDAPAGMTNSQLMNLFGIDGATVSNPVSYETMISNGVTFDTAVDWMNFYAQEALVNPANPVAASRAAQIASIVANWP